MELLNPVHEEMGELKNEKMQEHKHWVGTDLNNDKWNKFKSFPVGATWKSR